MSIELRLFSILCMFFFSHNLIFNVQVYAAANLQVDSFTLEQCIETALENSPTLKRQKISFEQSQITHQISRTVYDLQLSLDGDTELGENDADWRAGFSQSFPRDIEIDGRVTRTYGNNSSVSYALTLSKKLLGGGSKLESMEAIDDNMLSTLKSAQDLDDQTRQIIRNVIQAYYRIVRQSYTRDIQAKRLDAAIKTLEHAKVREEPIDIANAQVEVPDREIALDRAERELNSGIDNLKLTMGLDQDIELKLNTSFEYQERSIDTEVYEKAEENRASIIKLHLDIERQKQKIKIAKERILPDLNLDFSVSDTRDAQGGSYRFSSPIDNRLGLSLDWPLMSRSDRLKAKREEFDMKNFEVQLFQSRQDLKKKLRDLIAEIKETARSIQLQEQALAASELRLNLFKDRWENGEISILEYIRSQNTYRNRQVQIIQQKTEYMSLLAEYDYLVGE